MIFSFLLLLGLSAPASAKFDDAALQKRMSSEEPILIYTWSPHMVLSQKGARELLASSKDRPYKVLVVMDANASNRLAREIVKKNGWPASFLEKNESRTLLSRGARIHYPSYQFVKKGELSSPLIPGYRTPAELKEIAGRYLP